MRAFRHVTWLAALLWLAAVLAHFLFVSSPAAWFEASQVASVLQTMDRTPGRCRIILVGSSPVIFGLSADTLEQGTGCETVNAGQVAIGHVLNPYLALVLKQARPGDAVVLSDRQWTQVPVHPQACEDGHLIPCLLTSFRFVPNLNEDVVRLGGFGLRRNAQGDLLEFPPLGRQPSVVSDTDINDLPYRVQRIVKQVNAIKAAGARPLLVPAPMLVSQAAMPVLDARLQALSKQVLQAVGPGIWLAPQLDTEMRFTSLDGQHASDAGRQRWTEQVQAAWLASVRPDL